MNILIILITFNLSSYTLFLREWMMGRFSFTNTGDTEYSGNVSCHLPFLIKGGVGVSDLTPNLKRS